MKQITFLLLHLGYGGIETATINTANALCKKYKIRLVSFYNLKENQTNLLDKRVEIKYLYDGEPNRELLYDSIKQFKIFSFIKEFFKSIKILINKKRLIIKEIKNDNSYALISTCVKFSILLNKYGKKDCLKIAQEHHHHNNNKKYINRLKSYNNINYLFALTTTLKKDYEKFLCGNKNIKIELMPNMIESSYDVISYLKSKNIISVGRLHEGKRIDELVRIFAKLKNKKTKLFIVGEGEEKQKIKKLIKELNLNNRVVMTGYLNKEKLKKQFLSSCVFAMTSVTEGLPMVLLEAMQYGVPCIAYETESGIKDIIDDSKNGYIIKDRNEVEFVNKLNSLLENDKELIEFQKKALSKSKRFTSKTLVRKWIDILENK